MEIHHQTPAIPLTTSTRHAELVQKFETDAEKAAISLLEAAQKLQQAANAIVSSPQKLECEQLTFEEFKDVRAFLQAALKKYEYTCYLKAQVRDVLEFS